VRCEPPNSRLYHFTGNLELPDPEGGATAPPLVLPVPPAAVLLRGCSLRNTHRVYGLVLYAGEGRGRGAASAGCGRAHEGLPPLGAFRGPVAGASPATVAGRILNSLEPLPSRTARQPQATTPRSS
jgi:hypothetical protein